MIDLSKEFFHILRDDDIIEWETNLPNDQHGDQAFEYDFDGSQERKWEEYIKDLEDKGIRGNLEYRKWSMIRDINLDGPIDKEIATYPLSSYKMIIQDYE